jgi:hypothetical protein
VEPAENQEDNPKSFFMKGSGLILRLELIIVMILLQPATIILSREIAGESDITGTKTNSEADTSKTSSLYAGAGYGSNMIYLGSTISGNQPFGYASLIYGLNNDLSIAVSANHLAGTEPFMAFYTGSVNYSHVFNSWFDIAAGIYRYQVTPSLTDSVFSSFTFTDITLGFDWKLLYTKISAGGLFTDKDEIYLQIRNSRYFQTPGFTSKSFYFSFDPYVNLLFGTLVRYETTYGTVIDRSPPFSRGKSNRYNVISYTSAKRTFNIMEVDFGLPVAFNADRFTVEAEAFYMLPAYNDEDFPGPKGLIFLLSAYFRIL